MYKIPWHLNDHIQNTEIIYHKSQIEIKQLEAVSSFQRVSEKKHFQGEIQEVYI